MSDPPRRASQTVRAARLRRRPAGLSGLLLALGLLFALAYVFILRAPPSVPAPQLRSVQGSYTIEAAQGAGSGTFTALAGGEAWGSFSQTAAAGAPGAAVDSVYAPAARLETTLRAAAGGAPATVTKQTGAWPPAWLLATRSPLDYQGLAADVRSAVEDGDTSVGVKPLEQDGRKVWRAALTLDGVTRELVVDQSSGLVTWCTDGSSTFTAAVDWEARPQATGAPALEPPPGARSVTVVARDYVYQSSAARAGSAAGFVPVVSGLAPDRYRQAAVATASLSGEPGAWLKAASLAAPADGGAGGGAGGGAQVVQLFARGLLWFEVRQLDDRAVAADLKGAYQALGATALSFERTVLQYGAFAGRTAATWYAASGPALLVGDGRRVVFVSGALTRQELVSLAEGFKPVTAGATASPAADPSPSAP